MQHDKILMQNQSIVQLTLGESVMALKYERKRKAIRRFMLDVSRSDYYWDSILEP